MNRTPMLPDPHIIRRAVARAQSPDGKLPVPKLTAAARELIAARESAWHPRRVATLPPTDATRRKYVTKLHRGSPGTHNPDFSPL